VTEPQERTETASVQPNGAKRRRARRPAATDWKALARDNYQLLSAGALLVVGIVFVILGWWGAAHTNIFTEQIPYLISGGLLGLGLIIASAIVAYSAVAQRGQRELRRDIAFMMQNFRVGTGATAEGGAPSADGRVYVVPGGRSYHVAGCPIIEGKEAVKELQPAQAIGSGYTACKLCGPD
jgi:hypothetical protein